MLDARGDGYSKLNSSCLLMICCQRNLVITYILGAFVDFLTSLRVYRAATLFGDADCDNSSSLFAWSSSSWLSTSSASSTPPYAHPLTIPDTPASSSSTNATAANVGSPLTTNTSSVAGAGGNSASTSASQVVLPLPSGPTFASSVPTATASTGSTDAQVNNSQAAFVATNWSLVPVQCSLDLTQSRVTLSPSAQATENLVEIVESAIDDTSYFVFSRTVERRYKFC